MSDKTVKIEYQFIGEDVGLTTKIDDIYKKLDKLGEGASVTIKKLDGLNKETITLTNNLGNSSTKMNVFSAEMKEMQREIALATAEVNRLNEALLKQQALMNSTGNKGSLTAQKELARLTNESAKAMQNLASVQKKLKTSALDFKGTPKFALMEKDLNNINNQLKQTNTLSNELSKNLSKKTYRVNGNTVSDIKNTNASTKAIETETKVLEQNTRAKIQNAKVQNSPFKNSGRITSDMKKIAEAYNSGAKLNTATDFKGTDLEVSGKTIASMYRSNNSNVKKLIAVYNKEVEKREGIAKKLNSVSAMDKTSKMTEAYIKQAVNAQKALKDVDDAINKVNTNKNFTNTNKNYRKTISNIDAETKAIEANTQAQNKNYQVVGNLSKLKGKSLTMDATASKAQEQAKNIGAIASQINTKAKALESAIKNNDTALIGTLQNEVRNLVSQRQALEKLQGKTLANTSNTKYQTVNAKTSTTTPISSGLSDINSQIQAQQALNNAKMEQLKIEQQIAQQNANTAKKQASNIKSQMQADEKRNKLALANIKAYEESRQKQRQQSQEYKQQRLNEQQQLAYNQAVKEAPQELRKLTSAYKSANSQIKLEDIKLKEATSKLVEKASKGPISQKDLNSLEKTITAQQKRVISTTQKISDLNQRANKVLSITGNEAKKVGNISIGKSNIGTNKQYRTTDGSNLKTSLSRNALNNVREYKSLINEMSQAQKVLEKNMLGFSKNTLTAEKALSSFKNPIGQIANLGKSAGQGIQSFGQAIGRCSQGLVGMGQNLQMVANGLRVLQGLSIGVLSGAINQGVEFSRSLMGISATLNRMEVDKKTGKVSVIDDSTFDGILENIAKTAREQSKNSIYDANQILEAYRETSLAGWDADEMIESMPSFIDLATVARVEGENFAEIVDLITDSLTSLGMAYEGIDIDGDGVFDEKIRKTSSNLAEEVQRLNDVMVKAANLSTIDVDELAESYKTAGSQLSSFGLEVEEISAIFAVLGNRGIKGSQAGTGISSIMANLTGKTGQAKKALDEITEKTGMDVYAWDKSGKYIGIDKHLEKLSGAFKKLKEQYGTEYGIDNLQLTQMLGGKHHFKTLAKLLEGYQSGEYTEVLAMLKNSSGETAKSAEIMEDSSWAKTKMAIVQVKDALMNLWDSMEPIYLKVLETIKKIANNFAQLSDSQKENILKWLLILAVLPSALSLFANVAIILGTVGKALSVFVVAGGKVISFIFGLIGSLTTFVSMLAGGAGFIASFSAGFPVLAGIIGTIASTISGLLPIIAGVIFVLLVFKDKIAMIGSAFKEAWNSSTGFFDFLKNWIMNIGKLWEDHIVKKFNSKIGKGGFVDKLIGMFQILANVMSIIPGKIGDIGKKLKEEVSYLKNNGLTSQLQEEAEKAGYNSVENYRNDKMAKEKAEKKQERLINITTKLTDLSGGMFGKLITDLQDLTNGTKQTITVEAIAETKTDYLNLQDKIKTNESKKLTLQTNIDIDREKVFNYNKQITELKKQLDNLKLSPKVNKKKIAEVEKELEKVTAQRDAQANLKLEYDEQLKQLDADLTKDREAVVNIKKVAEDNGFTGDLEFAEKSKHFEEEYGIKLVVDGKEDIEETKSLLRKLPGVEKELRAKLEITEDPDEYNEIMWALSQIDDYKASAEVLLQIQKQQDIISEADAKIKEIESEIEPIKAKIDYYTDYGNIKVKDLPEDVKKTVEDLQSKVNNGEQRISSQKGKIEKATNQINSLGFSPEEVADANNLFDKIQALQGMSPVALFDKDTRDVIDKLYGDKPGLEAFFGENPYNGQTDNKETQHSINTNTISFDGTQKGKVMKDDNQGNNYSYVNGEAKKNTEIIKGNTKAVNDNTDAVAQHNEELDKTGDTLGNTNYDTSGIDGFKQKMSDLMKQTGGDTDTLISKLDGVNEAMSGLSFANVGEAVAILYATMDEVRNKLISINAISGSTGVVNFTTMGEALKTKITEARELLTNMFGYINNTGLNSFNNMTSGLQTKLDEIKTSLSTLGEGIDTTGLSGIGEVLSTSISGARTALLNICGVANNSGVSSMTNMGNALTRAINSARTALLNVCGVARNSGVSAMSAMGNALTSAINGAKTSVAGIASQINSIKLNASTIKIPTPPTPVQASIAPASLASVQGINSAVRSINNTTSNSSSINTSNFNFNMKGIMSNNRKDIKDTAKQLTIYCKRKGL